jgi:SsrA-binding protein
VDCIEFLCAAFARVNIFLWFEFRVQSCAVPLPNNAWRERRIFSAMSEDLKTVATNRKAYHDYFIEETYEAGIALTGTEIKSVRAGAVNLRDSYAAVHNGEMLLQNVHISPYEAGNRYNVDPYRTRKLLLHRKEINRLMGRVREKGLTIVPLRMYLKKNRAKVEIALVKGKRQYDKRDTISKRDAAREMERAMKVR